MKIAVIRKECSFFRGGAERYCANLSRVLAERGHTVYVVAKECDPDIHPSVIHIPVKVNNLTSSSKNRSFHVNSQRALQELKVDKVYALSRSYPADAYRASDPLHINLMNIRYAGKIERFLQGLNPRHRTILALERGIFDPKRIKIVITNSRLTKSQILNVYPYPEERIHVIYNGVDLKKFSPGHKRQVNNKKVLRLLFVSQDFRRKGLIHLIEAIAILKGMSLPCLLQVVGSDNPSHYLKKAKRLGIDREIEFSGTSKSVEDYYREADLFVLPTQSDPFANVCLEAMACGLPVATTTNNGASEIIDEGETGYVLNESEPLPEQIVRVVKVFSAKTERKRDEMKKFARIRAEGLTILKNAEKTLELLALT